MYYINNYYYTNVRKNEKSIININNSAKYVLIIL